MRIFILGILIFFCSVLFPPALLVLVPMLVVDLVKLRRRISHLQRSRDAYIVERQVRSMGKLIGR